MTEPITDGEQTGPITVAEKMEQLRDELRATTGRNDCEYCANVGGRWCGRIYNCIIPRNSDFVVGVKNDDDDGAIYRRWDRCDGFRPVRNCGICEYYDEKSLMLTLADGVHVCKFPAKYCPHFERNDKSEKTVDWSQSDCANLCKNFSYKNKE